jgi:arylsulfatase A-like enzyme
VLAYLDENNLRDNTIIIFMSDNGPDGSDRSKLPGNDVWLPEAWDLSYENMGRIGSYVYPGAGWARASAGPMKLYKSFTTEGGIHSPAIVSFPGIPTKGKVNDAFLSVKDITPTILEFAGIENPKGFYKGASVEKISGLSFKSILSGESLFTRHDDDYLGWELFGHRAIRQGDWKLLWLSSKPYWLAAPASPDEWALYNIGNDPGEQNNLARSEPEKLQKLVLLWEQYVKEEGILLPKWTH